MASILAPLHALAHKDRDWVCHHSARMHLFELKKALISTSVLVLPNFRAEFVLDTDASADGLRTILSQLVSGRVHMNVIAYASRMLTRAERR